MLPTMFRSAAVLVVAFAATAWAQQTPDVPPRVIYVPISPEDAGVAQPEPPPPPPPPQVDVPPAAPAPEPQTRTFEAAPPLPPPSEPLDTAPKSLEPAGAGAMLDGHPRQGAFLSGPGSTTFLVHHSLMLGLGVLATQMIPRAIDPTPGAFTNEGARIAYLAGGLGGAAVGFTGAAIWQFTHWMSENTAYFGMINSLFGGLFLGGFTDLFTKDAYAIAWLTLIGSTAGAWLTAIVGGGDMALNKGVLITSGGVWGGIYAALIAAIIATTGGATNLRTSMDAIMIVPALGAAAMALASLKFNPSTAQIMRANAFGAGVGAVVLLISAAVLSQHFLSPVPYILGGVGAIGAKTLVSLLWAEAAAAPSSSGSAGRVSVWW